jgi:hypothetical protein
MAKKITKKNALLSAATDVLKGSATVVDTSAKAGISKAATKASKAIGAQMSVDAQTVETPFFKTANQLRGGILFTYTAAVFAVLGMFKKRSSGEFPLIAGSKISRFYQSATILRHHTGNGNFEKSGVFYRLTSQGAAKFQGRVTAANKNQSVDHALLPFFLKAIQTGIIRGSAANHLGSQMYQVKR